MPIVGAVPEIALSGYPQAATQGRMLAPAPERATGSSSAAAAAAARPPGSRPPMLLTPEKSPTLPPMASGSRHSDELLCQPADPNLYCAICQQLFISPMRTACGCVTITHLPPTPLGPLPTRVNLLMPFIAPEQAHLLRRLSIHLAAAEASVS